MLENWKWHVILCSDVRQPQVSQTCMCLHTPVFFLCPISIFSLFFLYNSYSCIHVHTYHLFPRTCVTAPRSCIKWSSLPPFITFGMHLGQGVFTESLFCWKHCAKNKESLQLSRQDCFRPACRAWTYWLFMASVHSQCPRSSLYQFVKYFECYPYTTHKESLGIFRHVIHICFLKAVLPHMCGKYLVNIYFPLNIPQRDVNSYLVCESFRNWRTLWKSNLGNMWWSHMKRSICLVPIHIQRQLAKW